MTTQIPGYKPDAIELYRCQGAQEFPAVLNFLSGIGFSGKAEVVALDVLGRGHLFFENGKVVQALEGATTGIDAVARMLIWERTEIHLYRRVVAPSREFSCNTNNLIMDATLLADQNAALWRSQARKLEGVPEPNAGESAEQTRPAMTVDRRTLLFGGLVLLVLLLVLSHGCRSMTAGTGAGNLSATGPNATKFSKRLEKGKKHIVPGLDLSLVALPGGTFERIYENTGSGGRQRVVAGLEPFWMSGTEVTQGDFAKLMGRNPSALTGEKLPVESVTWREAQFFCERLTGAQRASGSLPEGWEYRLPTELEWEYALAAGQSDFDPENVLEIAWIRDNSEQRTHNVGTKPANAWGLHDMLGNVNEWCLDWMGHDPSSAQTDEDSGGLRAFRGGSWRQSAEFASPVKRVGMQWESANSIIGFRPVLARVGQRPALVWDSARRD